MISLCFRDFLQENSNLSYLSRHVLHFKIEPGSLNTVSQYQDFQRKIATFLPQEYDRPIVYLAVKSQRLMSAGPSIAIIGGMGPLSDAALIQRVVHKLEVLNCRNYQLDLLSIPPPRNMQQILFGGGQYLYQLVTFLQSKAFSRVFLGSNTAHVYYPYFRSLSSSLEDLTKLVTSHLTSRRGISNILILGTVLAHQHQLYEKQFQKAGLRFQVLSASDQEIIQSLIDSTKSGVNSEHITHVLLGYIEKARQQYGIDAVLLGCTELSLLLNDERISRLYQAGIQVVDTEVEFANLIVGFCMY